MLFLFQSNNSLPRSFSILKETYCSSICCSSFLIICLINILATVIKIIYCILLIRANLLEWTGTGWYNLKKMLDLVRLICSMLPTGCVACAGSWFHYTGTELKALIQPLSVWFLCLCIYISALVNFSRLPDFVSGPYQNYRPKSGASLIYVRAVVISLFQI